MCFHPFLVCILFASPFLLIVNFDGKFLPLVSYKDLGLIGINETRCSKSHGANSLAVGHCSEGYIPHTCSSRISNILNVMKGVADVCIIVKALDRGMSGHI